MRTTTDRKMNTPQDLELRLAAVERQNSQLRRFVAVASLCAIALPLLAAFTPGRAPALEEVRAERFVLVDGAGKERAALEIDKETTPRLVLTDPEGAPRLLLAVDPATAYLILKDDQGKNRLGLAVDAYPHLMMHDETQLPRIHASVGIKGASSVLFSDGKQYPLGFGIDSKGMVWRKPEIDEQMKAEFEKGAAERPPIDPPAETGEKKKSG
jgi:hypothetical protein